MASSPRGTDLVLACHQSEGRARTIVQSDSQYLQQASKDLTSSYRIVPTALVLIDVERKDVKSKTSCRSSACPV